MVFAELFFVFFDIVSTNVRTLKRLNEKTFKKVIHKAVRFVNKGMRRFLLLVAFWRFARLLVLCTVSLHGAKWL